MIDPAIAAALPRVWLRVRAGFVLRGPPALRSLGVEDAAVAERLSALILAELARANDASPRAIDAASRAILERHLSLHGGLVSLEGPAPSGLPVLDGEPGPDPREPSLDLDRRARAERLAELLAAELPKLSTQDRAILEARARGASVAEAAAANACSSPRVKARERAALRHLRHLRHALAVHELRVADAELESALAGDPTGLTLAPTTRERILRATSTRVDPTPARAFGARATAAVGALAIGAGLWGAIAAGALPGPGDDKSLPPKIALRCEGACAPGAKATLSASAPRTMRKLAVELVDANGGSTWIADPMGGSFALPARAREAEVELGLEATLPGGPGPIRALAVFSRDRLSKPTLERIAAGAPTKPGTIATWSTVAGE